MTDNNATKFDFKIDHDAGVFHVGKSSADDTTSIFAVDPELAFKAQDVSNQRWQDNEPDLSPSWRNGDSGECPLKSDAMKTQC